MGKKVKSTASTAADTSSAISIPSQPPSVRFGPDWEACKKKYQKAGTWPRIFKQFDKFLAAKRAQPTTMFGSNDKPMSHGYKGFFKAHLTHDDSVVYKYSKDDHTIKIYGIWSHDELGTGDPPNYARMAAIGDRLNSQVVENRPKSI